MDTTEKMTVRGKWSSNAAKLVYHQWLTELDRTACGRPFSNGGNWREILPDEHPSLVTCTRCIASRTKPADDAAKSAAMTAAKAATAQARAAAKAARAEVKAARAAERAASILSKAKDALVDLKATGTAAQAAAADAELTKLEPQPVVRLEMNEDGMLTPVEKPKKAAKKSKRVAK